MRIADCGMCFADIGLWIFEILRKTFTLFYKKSNNAADRDAEKAFQRSL